MNSDLSLLNEKISQISNALKDVCFPIKYAEQYQQNYFVIPTFADSSEYSFYINNNDNYLIPSDKFVWDFFGSGELYFSLPLGMEIASVKNTFVTFYHSFVFDQSYLKRLPTQIGQSFDINTIVPEFLSDSIVTSVYSPTSSDSFAWSFSIDSFFTLKKSLNIPIKATPDPVCKYFSIKNTNLDILSKEYVFANRLDNFSTCSAPVLSDSGQLSSCPNFILNIKQSTCAVYDYDYIVVKSTSITPNNSTRPFSITLRYSNSYDSSHIFKIINDLDNTEVSSYSYSSDLSYEDIVPEAISIYEDYIDCYQDHSFSQNDLLKESISKTKLSYIETLIGN